MKLPYGISNFEKIREEGYYYVDKTRYLAALEESPESHIVILRSRRFGKTLFVNMLGWYYDLSHAAMFDSLFAGTYIHQHPTPKRGQYMMLTFNFSGINTETLENANEGFAFQVRLSVQSFLTRYAAHFSDDDARRVLKQERPNDLLGGLFQTLHDQGLRKSVYVLIDEYDHFANNILAQGKEMFKELVKTDGYVRPFYEALKKGTEGVVDRIFITGVMPILLDSLTSGFNIASNLSTDERFNEMFGFTDEEITPILQNIGNEIAREEVRQYYNGYRFSRYAEKTVYNSDMILYYGLRYNPTRKSIERMLDINVVSDYRKIRAVLSIGDKPLEEAVLTKIVREREVTISEITPMFILTQETEFRFDEEALLSLLFYMGYLTISGSAGLAVKLAMPNLVLESLYLDYMEHLLEQRADVWVRDRERLEMRQGLVDGKIDGLIAVTEKLLKGLSNRDYERFDEKYIKVVMLSLLSDVNIYIPKSEYEIGADGYVDICLQAAFEPQKSANYFIELKYVKARAATAVVERAEREGVAAMRKYLESAAAKTMPHLHGYVLVFRKDRCVKATPCHA